MDRYLNAWSQTPGTFFGVLVSEPIFLGRVGSGPKPAHQDRSVPSPQRRAKTPEEHPLHVEVAGGPGVEGSPHGICFAVLGQWSIPNLKLLVISGPK